jgi:hypothetical protein
MINQSMKCQRQIKWAFQESHDGDALKTISTLFDVFGSEYSTTYSFIAQNMK